MTAAGGAVNDNNKKVKFKICAPFTDCFTKKNNAKIDDTLCITW